MSISISFAGPAAMNDHEAPPQRRTLDRLFDTAATMFWEKGYAATTTREIAAAIGVQQASLYYHIDSKEDLLYKLCVASLEYIRGDVEAALRDVRDPLGRVRALIRAHVDSLLKYQVRHVTMLTEMRALSSRHRGEVLRLRKEYGALVRSVLEDAQKAGALRRDVPAQYLYLALLNVLNWAVVWFHRDQELSADRLNGLFAPVFLNGAATAPEQVPIPPAIAGVPRKRPAARTRSEAGEKNISERMLNAAAALFSKKGYAATSTREIAAVLRIQKASLYYHIESKEDLLYSICKSSLEQIHDDVARAVANVANPLERTRILVRAHVESMLRDQERHSATLSEMRALSRERLEHVISLRDAYEELVRSVLDEAQQAGALRADIPVKYLCLILLGLVNRAEVWYRRKGALSPAELGELLAAIFLTGAAAAARD